MHIVKNNMILVRSYDSITTNRRFIQIKLNDFVCEKEKRRGGLCVREYPCVCECACV